nr:transglycosylase SLT domain-containing protein [Methylobacterium sp. C25]
MAQAHAGTSLGGTPMELPGASRPSDWGATRLAAGDSVTQGVMAGDPASPPAPQPDADTLRFGTTSVPRPLAETILRASEATGVDPAYMMALADKESSFDTDVKSTASSAQGLFQFVTGTWLEMVRDYGARHGLVAEAAAIKGHGGAIGIADEAMRKRVLALRNDPFVSGLMAGEMIKRDRARIEGRLGRELKTTELYIAHFLGTASAGKFLSLSAEAPERNAQSAFGRAARANRGIFTAKDGGKKRSLTVAEVHERLGGMIDKRMSQFQAITDMITQESEIADQEHGDERPVLDARLRLKDDIVPPSVAPSIQ